MDSTIGGTRFHLEGCTTCRIRHFYPGGQHYHVYSWDLLSSADGSDALGIAKSQPPTVA
jgi:hypothetical protein